MGLVVLLAASAVFGLVVRQWDIGRMPPIEEVLEGNAALREAFRAGDAIRVRPLWFADARVALDRLPILMGDPLDDWELHRYERLFFAYSRSHAAQIDEDAEGIVGARTTVFEGPKYTVEVADILPQADVVVWDGLLEVESLNVVQRAVDGGQQRCDRWARESWHCGRVDDWIYVGAATREMGTERPHNCIAANAPPAGAAWVMRWDDVPARGRTLRFRAGNTFEAIKSERGAPLNVRLFVDDSLRWEHAFGINDMAYDPVSIDLPAVERVAVRFEVSTSDHFDRFFCFRPQVVEPSD